jgi:hypothetical protein
MRPVNIMIAFHEEQASQNDTDEDHGKPDVDFAHLFH